jgi:hypothetical protein
MRVRDAEPLNCPPVAMMPVDDGVGDGMTWAMVMPVNVEMFGFGALIAVAEVWSARLSAN